jgi:putative glycosyltransferase (TIGR04372 family)
VRQVFLMVKALLILAITSARYAPFNFLLLPFAVVTACLFWLIRSRIFYRLYGLRMSRIGPLALEIDLYMCWRQEQGNDKVKDLFYNSESPNCANTYLLGMWERETGLNIQKRVRFLSLVDKVLNVIPGCEQHSLPNMTVEACRTGNTIDAGYLYSTYPPQLDFTPEEMDAGDQCLRDLGIPKGAPIVGFHARDSAYLKTIYPDRDWGYHDYRDADIQSYMAAIAELAALGYYVVRMGSEVESELPHSGQNVIDYSSSELQSDFMDLYLSKVCDFFIGSSTGLTELPRIFRRPFGVANFIPINFFSFYFGQESVVIPKKLWLKDEGRFMRFSEILNSPVGDFCTTEDYNIAGIEVVENTPDEIVALVLEVRSRQTGVWLETDDRKDLQERFWSLWPLEFLQGKTIDVSIGTEFLQENEALLEK